MPLEQAGAIGFAVLIGVLLGALGSGGSVVIFPVLVYIAGVTPQSAVPISLAVVGTTSAAAAFLHARRGNFHGKAALLFGASGIVGAYLGSTGTHLISGRALMLVFSLLLLVVGVTMFRRARARTAHVCRPLRCLVLGAVAGALTGFIGVGGGFLIVPALVLLAGLDIKMAIGTSLAVIAFNSAAGLAGQTRYTGIDWALTAGLTAAALLGMLLGIRLAVQVSGKTAHKAFASLLIVLAIMISAVNT